ncbi:hypothetical protein [Oligoflexus sp.]|nr:hypothetical protein [Oligoflexus sp.]
MMGLEYYPNKAPENPKNFLEKLDAFIDNEVIRNLCSDRFPLQGSGIYQ